MQLEGGKKRKVLHLGYDYNPWEVGRGGVIVYQWAIMKALAKSGFDVSFYMGSKHTISNKLKTKIYYKDSVKVIELINSPRRHLDFACNPIDHLQNDTIDRLTEDILEVEKPDIVHIHDPRLFTVSVIDVIKARKIPVLKIIHNFFDLCPQGELMFKGKWICTDFQEGNKCRECMSFLPKESFIKERISNTLRGSVLHHILKRLWRTLKKSGKNNDDATNQHIRPLSYPGQSYKERRAFCIERLNMLDVIHCYSGRSAEILVNHGVKEEKINLTLISTDSIGQIKRTSERSKSYPVVFGYLTGESYIKGYEILLDAFAKLDQKKAKLIAYGFDEPGHFQDKYSNLNVEFRKAYNVDSLNEIMSGIDVGIVPSIWEEVFGIVGIEFLSAGVPVIGSNIGGIPEWLKDRENGLLVKARDSRDLSDKMELLVNEPGLITKLKRNIKPWKSMDEHAKEILCMYEKLL